MLIKYDGTFVKNDANSISAALDKNHGTVRSGSVMISLEAEEVAGEVVKQEFVLYVSGDEVIRSKDEDKIIKIFQETL